VWTIIEWFCTHGDLDQVAKGRLKFVIEARGETAFRAAFTKRFAQLRAEPQPPLPDIGVPVDDPPERVLGDAPQLGWRDGIRPERRAGFASLTVRTPLGDLLADELEQIADLAPTARLVITRDQNLIIQSVPVGDVSAVVDALAQLGLGPDGTRGATDVRACPGLAFCSLAITASQPVALAIEQAMNQRPDLPSDLTVAVSGCPNSCTKHQAADVGLAGAKVRIDGQVGLGYQLFLGADLPAGIFGEPVVRLREDETPRAVVAVTEVWVALRRPGERPGATFRRVGLDVVATAIEHRLRPPACRDSVPGQPTDDLRGVA
jgi:sulfite reductase beta subunit-like hemoprotein